MTSFDKGDRVRVISRGKEGHVSGQPRVGAEKVGVILEGHKSWVYFPIEDVERLGPSEKIRHSAVANAITEIPALPGEQAKFTVKTLLELRADIGRRLLALDESLFDLRVAHAVAPISRAFDEMDDLFATLSALGSKRPAEELIEEVKAMQRDTARAQLAANALAAKGKL